MNVARKTITVALGVAVFSLFGCTAKNVDFSAIERPARAAELDAYDVFVGSWDWTAEAVNAAEPDKDWKGTAKWNWSLDKRVLHGMMEASSTNANFEAAGIWSWHPKSKKYIWSMFNNWGYPQDGSAKFNEETRTWSMTYKSIGLDGTTSFGGYTMEVVDNDTMKWSMNEWADAFHTIKKLEMNGTYIRRE